jgi:hypothetical protein
MVVLMMMMMLTAMVYTGVVRVRDGMGVCEMPTAQEWTGRNWRCFGANGAGDGMTMIAHTWPKLQVCAPKAVAATLGKAPMQC